MGRRQRLVVGIVALGVVATVTCVVSIPLDSWSRAWFGNRFELLGEELEGDGIVFLVDRSGSSGPGLAVAKDGLARLAREAPPHFRIGAIFFDRSMMRSPPSGPPLPMRGKNRRDFVEFVTNMPGGSASCIWQALEGGLDMLSGTHAERRLMIYIGDGGGTCMGQNEQVYLQGALEDISAACPDDVEIHCFAVNSRGVARDFLIDLAGRCRGTFREVTPPSAR